MKFTLFWLDMLIESDAVSARQRARQISSLLGYDDLEQARIATAVSEIARNAMNYAGGGTLAFEVDDHHESGGDPEFRITVSDRGPGIADLPAVLEGRFKPRHAAAGLGIVSARRLMDGFEIDSAPGQGTTVVLGKRFPRQHTIFTAADLGRIRRELARTTPQDPLQEIRQQNHELVRTMEELRRRQEELERLNRELEDTNRGVVALYAELDEKASHLRQADEVKTRFLSNMSHEFRTPLNSVLALSRMLLERADGPLTEDQVRQVAYIQKNAQDLSELVNDLLDLAKVEAGRITVNPSEMEVKNLFAGLRGIFRPLLANSPVNLVFEEPEGVPTMFTDDGKISQILRNFISNALKFTERGEVDVRAEFDAEGGRAIFSVRDTGIGIAPEDQERIFEEFTQLDNPIQRKVKGTGLGLPLSKKLAELLGGSVWVESRLGTGSTFYAAIPVAYSASEATAYGTSAKHDVTRYPLLVVEDEPETILLYEKYLKHSGYQVLPARTVDEARRLMQGVRPLAIVLDLLLPGGGAWDFLTELKRTPATRDVPVFVISVLEEAQRALALGADDYLTKPVDRKWLLERLRKPSRRATAGKILVVDDDDVARYLLRDLLADTRYQVLEASEGFDALRQAQAQHPNIILLDLSMPGLDGYQVLERLKADPATCGIPVIIVTSKSLSEEDRLLLSRNVVAILSKDAPSRQEAIARMREALATAETRLAGKEGQAHGQ